MLKNNCMTTYTIVTVLVMDLFPVEYTQLFHYILTGGSAIAWAGLTLKFTTQQYIWMCMC